MTRRSLLVAPLSLAASETKIRAAVIGTKHAHAAGKTSALRALGQYELAGVWDPQASEFPMNKAYEGVRRLSEQDVLGDRSIELVAVETSVGPNLRFARMAVEAGKYVHLDKAPGDDLAGLRSLFDEAKRRNRVVQIGYQWRYHPAMRAALQAAREGWLGQVYMVRASINKIQTPAERAGLAAFRGGMMFELGCHMIDRVVDLLGTPRRVTGIMRHDGRLADKLNDNTLAILEFDKAMAEVYIAAHQPNGNEYRTLELLGTNGTIAVRPFTRSRLYVDLQQPAGPYSAGPQVIEPPAEQGPSYAPDFNEMARVIRAGEKPSYRPEHDLVVQKALLEACGMSS